MPIVYKFWVCLKSLITKFQPKDLGLPVNINRETPV